MVDSVYMVISTEGPIKIGRSSCPEERLKQLTCPLGGKVKPLAIFRGIGKYERSIHRALNEHALGNEWFSPHQDVLRLAGAENSHSFLKAVGIETKDVRKPSEHETEQDVEDLERAAQMVKDGKALRQRVLSRIRMRKFRQGRKEPSDG